MRAWLALALAIFFVRILVIVFVMPDSGLVPDEGLYVAITDGLSRQVSPSLLGVQLGYGPDLVSSTWLLSIPSTALLGLGLPDYAAVRLTSAFFSLLSALLFVVVVALVRSHAGDRALAISPSSKPTMAILSGPGIATLVFLLMPSHIMWGTLALRDSSSEFAALCTVAGVTLVLVRRTRFWNLVGFLIIVIGLVFLQGSRSYLFAFMFLAILAVVVWWPRGGRPTIAISLLAAAFIGLLLGGRIESTALDILVGRTTAVTSEGESSATETTGETPSATDTTGETPSATDTTGETPSATDTTPGMNFIQGQVLSRIDSRVSVFSVNREKMMENAQSAYSYNYCLGAVGLVETTACELTHVPLGISRFLGQPLYTPWNDSMSTWRTLAGIENLAWIALLIGALLTLVMRRTMNPRMTSMIVVYTVLFIVGYALVSGNEGTAFRHKSQMLWAISLIIAFGYGWRPWAARLGNQVQIRILRRQGSEQIESDESPHR